jgi:hypothetical protein
LQKIAIAIAGFRPAATRNVLGRTIAEGARYPGVTFIVGGIIGAILLLAVFDWALIVLSAVVGAYLISHTIVLPPTGATLLFVGLAAIGVIVQASTFRGRRVA